MNKSPNKPKNQTNRITGNAGEDIACRYLIDNGYEILKRNYRIGHDEIDIIAENAQYIVFVEVKTRTDILNNSYGRPSNAVTATKRKCLARCAEGYRKSIKTDKFFRFDVIEVLISHRASVNDCEYKVNHMKGVFGASGKIWI